MTCDKIKYKYPQKSFTEPERQKLLQVWLALLFAEETLSQVQQCPLISENHSFLKMRSESSFYERHFYTAKRWLRLKAWSATTTHRV